MYINFDSIFFQPRGLHIFDKDEIKAENLDHHHYKKKLLRVCNNYKYQFTGHYKKKKFRFCKYQYTFPSHFDKTKREICLMIKENLSNQKQKW